VPPSRVMIGRTGEGRRVVGPAVSVVLPTRGDSTVLVAAVRSVLRQTVDLELILVPGPGSGDRIARHVRSWGEPRVRVAASEAAGGAAARNLGAEHATGRVVAFLDEVDVWFGGKLDAQLAALEATGSCWSYGSALLFSADRTLEALLPAPPAPAAVERLPYVNAVPGGGSNVIVTRDALQAAGGFDPAVPQLDDWDLWIRLAQLDRPAVVEATVVACRHGTSMSHARLTELLASARLLDDRYRSLRAGRPLDWADLHRWLCHDALRFGPRSVALRLAVGSLRQRHVGAGDLALRSLLPVRRRPPVRSLDEVTRALDRRFPPRVVRWPDDTEAELRSLLAAGEPVR
jgi:glycosyltransferase involved in cell wall biosynthesis